MAVATDTVAANFQDVVSGTPLNCAFPLYDETEVDVLYGQGGIAATLNVDYTVIIAEDFNSFTVTPLDSLLTKINALIAANDLETNSVTIRGDIGYETSSSPELIRASTFLAREIDRITVRCQQLREAIQRSIKVSSLFVGSVASNFMFPSPLANRAIVWNDDGTALINGPNAADIVDAQPNAATAVGAKNDAIAARDQTLVYANAAAASATAAADVAETLSGGTISMAMAPVCLATTLANGRTALGLDTAATHPATDFDAAGAAAAALVSAETYTNAQIAAFLGGTLTVDGGTGRMSWEHPSGLLINLGPKPAGAFSCSFLTPFSATPFVFCQPYGSNGGTSVPNSIGNNSFTGNDGYTAQTGVYVAFGRL